MNLPHKLCELINDLGHFSNTWYFGHDLDQKKFMETIRAALHMIYVEARKYEETLQDEASNKKAFNQEMTEGAITFPGAGTVTFKWEKTK